MKNINEILADFGLSVPEDKQEDFNSAFAANYKTVSEFEKKIGKTEADRDKWKEKAETAENTLKGFEGADIETMKNDLATWKKKAEDLEADYEKRIYERDFEDALKIGLDAHKFTSESAKRSIMAEIRDAGLKLKNGKILGLDDAIKQAKENDPGAFVDENKQHLEDQKAKFTDRLKIEPGQKLSRDEIAKIKDPIKRQAYIAANIEQYRKG